MLRKTGVERVCFHICIALAVLLEHICLSVFSVDVTDKGIGKCYIQTKYSNGESYFEGPYDAVEMMSIRRSSRLCSVYKYQETRTSRGI